MSEIIVEDVGFTTGEDCPLCLDKLPPMWESFEVGRTPCCGKRICRGCVEGKNKYLFKQIKDVWRIVTSRNRTEQKQLVQLMGNCPLCRAEVDGDERKEMLLRQNSEKGKGWADYALHYHYHKEDKALSLKHLLLAAERGFPPALYLMSYLYSSKEHPEYDIKFSLSDSLQACAKAANSGHAEARYKMALYLIEEKDGGFCENGKGDVETAIKVMNLAAEEGYTFAYCCLGNIYKYGQYGIEKDDLWMRWYFAKGASAEINLMAAGLETGFDSMYEMGCLELEKEKKANKLGKDKAALEGINAYESYKLAHHLFEKAGIRGHMPSQEKMAWLLTRVGPNKPKFYTAGICWAQMALNNGSDWAKGILHNKENEQKWCNICFYCNATAKGGETRFHRCARCQIAHYCSKKCQKLHWHEYGHKDFCGRNIITFKSDKSIDWANYK